MTLETGPRTETHRPQRKALRTIQATIRAEDTVMALSQTCADYDKIEALKRALVDINENILESLPREERSEYVYLHALTLKMTDYPLGNWGRLARFRMTDRGYTPFEMESFIETVENTRKYRQAHGLINQVTL